MQRLVISRWFTLSTLILVIASGICLYVWPKSWPWALLTPVVLSILRLVVKPVSFQTPFWIATLVIFLATAAIGYTVAYNEKLAWSKFCLIIIAAVLYIIVATQPVKNLNILASVGLLAGVGVASYFLLTADFSAFAVKFRWIHWLGMAWMKLRPYVFQFPSIPPNDAAGISIIAASYGLPLLQAEHTGRLQKLIVRVALGIVLLAVLLASSRGAFLALIGAVGIWSLWRRLLSLDSPLKEKLSRWFPYIVMAGVLAAEAFVLFVPSGIVGSTFSASGNVFVSRADVFRSGLMILRDFPFTGGGLASFPGLYSQYVMAMPFYQLPHSHNMILDVMIEQGVLGGTAFMMIYLMAIRQLLSGTPNASTQGWYLAACISLFTAVFHGMVDNYLYGTSGPVLSLVPAGMAMLVSRLGTAEPSRSKPATRRIRSRAFIPWQYPIAGVLFPILIVAFLWRPIAAQWYANMGAVKMAQIELADFPSGKWSEGEILSALQAAELDFQQALDYQSNNHTANYRLGLIRMSARDYANALGYLQNAYVTDPTDRGVIKNLGYTYLWLGEIEKARPLLSEIPEVDRELQVYVWWWEDRERPDLSAHASQLLSGVAAPP